MTRYLCPSGCDLRGEPIDERHFAPELHVEPYCSEAKARHEDAWCPCLPYGDKAPEDRFYSRVIGVEVPGVYDGVLFYRCPDCGIEWDRFERRLPA